MEELTRLGMRNSLTLPPLANKFFKSLRDENDEPIYTHTDEYMRYFVRQSIKGVRCTALHQYHKSIISDEVFISILIKLDIIGNICDIFDKFFKITIKHGKMIEDEYDSHFTDNRDINQDEKAT